MIVPFDENKVKFSRNSRYQFFTEAMWEIENHPDVLCLDKDDTAEEFLCDAYGVVMRKHSPSQQKKTNNEISEKIVIDLDEDDIDAIADITLALDTSSDVRSDGKKGAIIDNLEFSDDDSEDMTPLYSKLINITGSRDLPPASIAIDTVNADSSSAIHEAEAMIRNVGEHKLKECRVVLERLSNKEICKALKLFKSGQLLSTQCVTTINKEPRVLDTIIIDSDDNNSSHTPPIPDRVPVVADSKMSEVMPKSRQINIPRWPKPMFEKNSENSTKADKPSNVLAAKKVLHKSKDKFEKKEKHEIAKKITKEVPLSFDNLFKKNFNILGSGFKIAKKVPLISQNLLETEDTTKMEVIELVEDIDPPSIPIQVAIVKNDEVMDEDCEAEKWCKAQDWGNDDMGDIGDFVELNLPDDDGEDDNGSNDSWTHGPKQGSPKNGMKMEVAVEIEDDDDPEFMDMVDRNRREKFPDNIVDVKPIVGNDDNYREVMEHGDDFVEGFEDDVEWRPADTGDYGDGGKWFEVDKFNYCQSPPRYCDLVENKVIKSPPMETDPVKADKLYDLWADSKPRRSIGNQKINSCNNAPSSYGDQGFMNSRHGSQAQGSGYQTAVQPVVTRDPRIAQSSNNKMKVEQTEVISDVWRKHIETKKQSWEQRRSNGMQGGQQNRNMGAYGSQLNQDPRGGIVSNMDGYYGGGRISVSGEIDRNNRTGINNGAGSRSGVSGYGGYDHVQRYGPDVHYGPRPEVNNSRSGHMASNMSGYPTGTNTDPRTAYQHNQYGMGNLYPAMDNDPNMLYQYYPHLFPPGFGGAMFMNHRFPVPMTPASPDAEDMGNGNGAFNPYFPMSTNTTYTPASPDPVDQGSQQQYQGPQSSTPQSPDDAYKQCGGLTTESTNDDDIKTEHYLPSDLCSMTSHVSHSDHNIPLSMHTYNDSYPDQSVNNGTDYARTITADDIVDHHSQSGMQPIRMSTSETTNHCERIMNDSQMESRHIADIIVDDHNDPQLRYSVDNVMIHHSPHWDESLVQSSVGDTMGDDCEHINRHYSDHNESPVGSNVDQMLHNSLFKNESEVVSNVGQDHNESPVGSNMSHNESSVLSSVHHDHNESPVRSSMSHNESPAGSNVDQLLHHSLFKNESEVVSNVGKDHNESLVRSNMSHNESPVLSSVHHDHNESSVRSSVHHDHNESPVLSSVHHDHNELPVRSSVHHDHNESPVRSSVHHDHNESPVRSSVTHNESPVRSDMSHNESPVRSDMSHNESPVRSSVHHDHNDSDVVSNVGHDHNDDRLLLLSSQSHTHS